MSRLIRCPSCAAVYPVDMAQMQAAHGWLRCGKCQEAFNGTGLDVPATLHQWPQVSDGLAAESLQVPSSVDPVSRVPLNELLLREDRSDRAAAPNSEVSADLMAFSEALATFKPELPPLEPATQLAEKKAKGRIVGYAMAAVLGLLLMGQAFFLQRHAMAALWPNSLPVLEILCRPLQCQLKPWMNPKAIVMEGASFVQSGESFLLNWTLRNTGPMTVATKSLELSLLDEFNNPVVRRVFLPDEAQAPEALLPGQVWKGSLTVQLDPLLVFTQYRLVSFYP
jgi:predicted Zn finger-like uncharacterized protein